jgi:hypothetical protein
MESLQKYESDFNPHYANSIAYRPLPRAAMEAFLIQRGMLSPKGRVKKAIYHGLLNKFYFRLNQIAFHNTNNVCLTLFFFHPLTTSLFNRPFSSTLATYPERLI